MKLLVFINFHLDYYRYRLGLQVGFMLGLGLGLGFLDCTVLQKVCVHRTCTKPFSFKKANKKDSAYYLASVQISTTT